MTAAAKSSVFIIGCLLPSYFVFGRFPPDRDRLGQLTLQAQRGCGAAAPFTRAVYENRIRLSAASGGFRKTTNVPIAVNIVQLPELLGHKGEC
jgi:hypothetical protein